MPEESSNSRGGRVTPQSVAKIATKVAEEILKHPEKHQDTDPSVIQAIESVMGMLQQRAVAGTDLAKTLELAKAAVDCQKTSGAIRKDD